MTLNSDDRFMRELRAAMEADLTGTAGTPSISDTFPSGLADPYKDSSEYEPEAPGDDGNPTDLGGESTDPEEQPYEGDTDSGNAGSPGDDGDPAEEGFLKNVAGAHYAGKVIHQVDPIINRYLADFPYKDCLKPTKYRANKKEIRNGGRTPLFTVDLSDYRKKAPEIWADLKRRITHMNTDIRDLQLKKGSANIVLRTGSLNGEILINLNIPEDAGKEEKPAQEAGNPFAVIAGFFSKKNHKPLDMDQMVEAFYRIVVEADEGHVIVHGAAGKRSCEKFSTLMEDKYSWANDTEDLYNVVSCGDVFFAQIRADYEIDPRTTYVVGVPVSKSEYAGKPGKAALVSNVMGWTMEEISSFIEAYNKKMAKGDDIGTSAAESDFDGFLKNMEGNSIISRVVEPQSSVDGDKLKDEANDPVQPDDAGDDGQPNPPKNGQAPAVIGDEREPGTGDTESGNAGNPTGVNGSPVSKSGAPTEAAPSSFARVADDPSGNPPSPGADATPAPSLDSFIGALEHSMIGGKQGSISIPDGMTLESYAMEIGMGELVARALESDMTAAERNALPDSAFGLPSQRKWPLNDEVHVRQAIKYFWRCPRENQKELAKNILKAMRKFGVTDISVSANNPFKDYYPKAKIANRGGAKGADK